MKQLDKTIPLTKRIYRASAIIDTRVVLCEYRQCILSILLCFLFSMQTYATLKTYKAPSGVTLNTAFTVQVRETGTSIWQDLDEYNAVVWKRVTNTSTNKNTNSYPNTSFVCFDCSGSVDIKVTWNSASTLKSVRVRPNSKGITPAVSGKTVTFTISGPQKLSLDVSTDGVTYDIYQNLQIFANPIEENVPSASDPNVIFIPSGTFQTGDVTLKSGQTLYIAGGAALKGCVYVDNTANTKILGRGIIYQPSYDAISAKFASNITVDGITVVNYGSGGSGGCAFRCGQSQNVTIRNYKTFSKGTWGDGVDVFCSSHITLDDVFIRSSDDAFAVYATRGDFTGDCYDISVLNSILAPDIAHPINIGTHGDTSSEGNTISKLLFKNIDILEQNEYQTAYQGTMALTDGDKNYISNIRFEDIRVEDFTLGELLNLSVVYNTTYNTAAGRGINGLYFKNVSYNGANKYSSPILGYDTSRIAQNITFENLQINGSQIVDAASGKISVSNYTKNIRFISSGDGLPVVTDAVADTVKLDSLFRYSIQASGNPTAFYAFGLPVGLSMDSISGVVSGAPSKAGRYYVTVAARNTIGTSVGTLVITVVNPNAVVKTDVINPLTDGDYFIKDASTGLFYTNDGSTQPSFKAFQATTPLSQSWEFTIDATVTRYKIVSNLDGRFLEEHGRFNTSAYYPDWNSYTLWGWDGDAIYAIQNGGSAGIKYWGVSSLIINGMATATENGHPFEILPYNMTGTKTINESTCEVYPTVMSTVLSIIIPNKSDVKADFVLYSVNGQIMKTVTCDVGINNISVENIPTGFYLGCLNIEGQEYKYKLLKKN